MEQFHSVPPLFTHPPLLEDGLLTRTTELQAQTIEECLPLLVGAGLPHFEPVNYNARGFLRLDAASHIAFIHTNLSEFPAPFVSIDASRPWMIYWGLLSLYYLGEDVTVFRDEVTKTFLPLQNQSGGYGGGQGHSSHLACTYASLLALAIVGGEQAYELTDRRSIWEWLGRLKQADGGFRITEDGEEDTRASYTALLTLALLDLPWELPPSAKARQSGLQTFGDGLGDYLSRCQTYEGGISSSPGTEAHGAYTFCAIACLCLLGKPHETLTRYLDIDTLIEWLSSRQYAPEGGLAGRTNKVVDGCYSHWLGTCWPMIQAALRGPVTVAPLTHPPTIPNLYSTEGLGRYILNCCQSPDGGLRDKPSKPPDSYHTCYTLTGISTSEHCHYYTEPVNVGHFASAFTWDAGRRVSKDPDEPPMSEITQDSPSEANFDASRGLNAVHPVFAIPHEAVHNIRRWAQKQARII